MAQKNIKKIIMAEKNLDGNAEDPENPKKRGPYKRRCKKCGET